MVRRVAKYDWNNLEKEYILSDYKSVSAFLKNKGIPNNGSTKKSTKGWKEKKVQKEYQKSTKTIEKVIEKEAERDSEQIVKVNEVANKLLNKIMIAADELNKDVDALGNTKRHSILNRSDLKKLSSALKDINEVLENKSSDSQKNNDGIITDLIGALNEYKKDR